MADPIRKFSVEKLSVAVYADPTRLAQGAAREVRGHIVETLARQGTARVILATGNSQLQFLEVLAGMEGVDWSAVTLFHMDEYLGITGDHPSSFRFYMRERVEKRLVPGCFHYLQGDALEPIRECKRYGELLLEQPIDLCCLGIGDNGHLAFNDPPVANFEDRDLVKIVRLDDICKTQQANQGHFPNKDAVPPYALTLTIPALCLARRMICLCPGQHKAKAVKDTLEGPVGPGCPASVLRTQSQAELLLDAASARDLRSAGIPG
ncbi:MAG: glucosamine-6-phosphate deaminase [Verrucomicrobia bacterium]|nr:glucosamine-6-phosphate deaminase [Verrucomicrobiota bacterium]